MNVAFIASEAVPFAKTGGLADVAGTLPPALDRLGHSVSLFLPGHRSTWNSGVPVTATGLTLRIPVGSTVVEGVVYSSHLPNSDVRVYLIDQPAYFDRDQLYQEDGDDYADNCERFVFFNRAVLEAIRRLDIRPHIIHCNDWQTGLIPVYLKEFYRQVPGLAETGTLLTIHNLAYQGIFRQAEMALTGLDSRLFTSNGLEFYGRLNFMKAGLVFADMLSTVSPTYAREIQTPFLGCGLDGLLRARHDDFCGIVNGIDMAIWSRRNEPMLAMRYDATTVSTGKAACKAQLQRRASLPERQGVPVFAQIGRLDPQKGWDLLAEVADDLLRGEVQLVVLGEGQPRFHELLDRLAEDHPGKFRAFLEFSGSLAHQIEAGADLFDAKLVRALRLNQLYSLAHGTVPIVRATGGLADTVVDATPGNLADGTATGFVFVDPTAEALRGAIERALTLWPDRTAWNRLVQAGMSADWSWDRSARAYDALYREIRAHASARTERRKAVGIAV